MDHMDDGSEIAICNGTIKTGICRNDRGCRVMLEIEERWY
jgi:hypothetical protein